MHHHPVFAEFKRQRCIADGRHVYDFLGSATDTNCRKGWERHLLAQGREVIPEYPPLNEHYFDWVATLECVNAASGTFRMAELGAGWAPWLARAALACHQRPQVVAVELVAVEADPTHFAWAERHLMENGLSPKECTVLHGAIAPTPGTIRFPKLEHPDEDYGASTRAVGKVTPYIEVRSYSIPEVLDRFSGPLDFMHVDIQGAEYDVLPPAMADLGRRVKSIMVGTHLSLDAHRGLAALFAREGWRQIMNFDRNATCETGFGQVTFGDGFLYLRNPRLPA
jgi:FkbM family methyltransferase